MRFPGLKSSKIFWPAGAAPQGRRGWTRLNAPPLGTPDPSLSPQRQARRISHRSKTDLLSISVTHRIVAKNFDLGASIKTVTLSVTPTVPFVPKVGRLPTVPLFGSHTHAPIGRAALRGVPAFLRGPRDSVSRSGDLKRHQAKFERITRCAALKRAEQCCALLLALSPCAASARADPTEILRRTCAVNF